MASIPCAIYPYAATAESAGALGAAPAVGPVEMVAASPLSAIRRAVGWVRASKMRAKVGPADAPAAGSPGDQPNQRVQSRAN